MTLEVAVCRGAPLTEIWTIFSETDERFNTVRDERTQPHTRHLPRSALEYHALPISSEGLANRHTELEYCRVAIKRASD